MKDILIVEGDNEVSTQLVPLIPFVPYIEIVDLDSNNNKVVDGEDEAAFLAAYGSIEGEPNYDRQLDVNFNGKIDSRDYVFFYRTLGKNLDVIRNSIKTGVYEHLVWPDGWDAYLAALNKNKVQEFTGAPGEEGWISVRRHPYILVGYSCLVFAVETAVAAYKALGYGCLLAAASSYNGGHGYNIFWVGGDWRDLNNWYILEPQSGVIFGAANVASVYKTKWIIFHDYTVTKPRGEKVFHYHYLLADYAAKTVGFGESSYSSFHKLYQIHGMGLEEPVPDVFDRALGVLGGL